MVFKIATFVGARPQFIKASQVSRAIAGHQHLKESLIHTGQHYDKAMSDVFFEEMEIPKPDYYLGIGGLSQGAMTARMLEAIEKKLIALKPDWVLVYGDTNTTLAAALAAIKLHIPIAHVESGLRSFNQKMPEEVNRVLVDHMSTLLFTPTAKAKENLLKEGLGKSRIEEVGDVMTDALFYYLKKAEAKSSILNQLEITKKKYVLATIHRQENTDDLLKIKEIVDGFCMAAKESAIIWPLHPRTEKMLKQENLYEKAAKNIKIISPVGYFDMLLLEKNAKLIATDSGGVQKEAYLLKVPCLTIREETEWKELVEIGCNRLVPSSKEAIFKNLRDPPSFSGFETCNLYGDGTASKKIVEALANS